SLLEPPFPRDRIQAKGLPRLVKGFPVLAGLKLLRLPPEQLQAHALQHPADDAHRHRAGKRRGGLLGNREFEELVDGRQSAQELLAPCARAGVHATTSLSLRLDGRSPL